MTRQVFVVVVLGICILGLAGSYADAGNDYNQPVSQLEFAVGLHAAILGQARSTLNPADSLQVLKDGGIVPGNWDGKANVTTGQAQKVFDQLGIQIYVKDPAVLLSRGDFELILRQQLGQFQVAREHWRIQHGFSTELTLGQYRERVISGSGF